MSDDLVKRLRNFAGPGRGAWLPQNMACREAADRIEALQAERDAAVLALNEIGSPAFIRPIVQEQSCGEWGSDIIDEDTAKICAAIRARSNKEPGQ